MEIISQAAIAAAPDYNEAEVRFHILDPILRALGYPGADGVYVKLEQKLEYPYIHIGHRSKKDVPLGFPDYRAGLMGARGSFIVEAKAGRVPITIAEVEQGHSYAAHSQIGANFFALGNGIEVLVFETLSGHKADPIVQIPIAEINARFHELENILGPACLEKNCRIAYDRKMKLCDGLASSMRLGFGRYDLTAYSYRIFADGNDVTEMIKAQFPLIAQLDEKFEFLRENFDLRVTAGAVERGEDGRITAYADFLGATKNNAEAMKMLGLDRITVVTNEKFLSRDPEKPTILEATKQFLIAKGAMVGDLLGPKTPTDIEMDGEVFIRAAMWIEDTQVSGEYLTLTKLRPKLPFGMSFEVEIDVAGMLEMEIVE